MLPEIWPLTDDTRGPNLISRYKNPYFKTNRVSHVEFAGVETYTFPMLPIPFTIPMAAARFLKKVNLQCVQFRRLTYAGGRGTAFDTHTSVIANPFFH